MALHEADREDLLREATALVRRAELALPGEGEPVVAGFHRDGRLSVYFGADAAYHLDPAGRLRRAFVGGRLFRTQGTTLARLTRHRTPATTELLRHDLTAGELTSFLSEMRSRLQQLHDALLNGQARVVDSVPADVYLASELIDRLAAALDPPAALAPPFRGKGMKP